MEPNLNNLIKNYKNNLIFVNEIKEVINNCDNIFTFIPFCLINWTDIVFSNFSAIVTVEIVNIFCMFEPYSEIQP